MVPADVEDPATAGTDDEPVGGHPPAFPERAQRETVSAFWDVGARIHCAANTLLGFAAASEPDRV